MHLNIHFCEMTRHETHSSPPEPLCTTLPIINANVFVNICSTTKACVLVSIVFVLEKKSSLLVGYPHDVIYFFVVAFFVYFKLNAIFFQIHDPFAPFENLFCALFMGGIWDALR